MIQAVDLEIKELIKERGKITFAEFMRLCLYSPNGGFYASPGRRISDHFGTSPASHPVFGSLVARQLEQMWRLLEEPDVFHLIEVGSGEGTLAQSIVDACQRHSPQFARALRYVAVDYQPAGRHATNHAIDGPTDIEDVSPLDVREPTGYIYQIRADGLKSIRSVTS